MPMRKAIRAGITGGALLALLAAGLTGCGYRLTGSGISAGEGQTLAVPVFVNETNEFRIEQRLTEAVRQELVQRTRYRIVPEAVGDVVLRGRVLGINTAPTIFTDRGRAIVYTVAVDVGVEVTDGADGSVVLQNDSLRFRESFEVSNDSADFVPEDAAAIDRLAGQFAAYLTASLLRATP